MTTPTPNQNIDDIIDDFRQRFDIHTDQEYLNEPPSASSLEAFIRQILEANDSYWKGEMKGVVEGIPTEYESFDPETGGHHKKYEVPACVLDYKAEKLKNLNGI